MRRLFLCLAFLFLFGCAGHTQPKPFNSVTLASRMEGMTVALTRMNDEGEFPIRCAGVWVAQDKVLTAAHCLRRTDLAPVWVRPSPGPSFFDRPAKVLAKDEETDLGLLEVTPLFPHLVADIRQGAIEQGESCYVMGHPGGDALPWSFSVGWISAIREGEEGGFTGLRIQTQAPVWFGNSGGGMFDAYGRLEGIASTLDRNSRYAFFVHRDSIASFLLANQGHANTQGPQG